LFFWIRGVYYDLKSNEHYKLNAARLRTPLVTVIVPCFNHESFLVQRLESIYRQTYQNFNVVLLDDCSTDMSVSVLTSYRDKYPDKTVTFFNDKNSGGVFNQWALGLSKAEGELIWIAESDDYCDLNFLEEMVTSFSDDSVMLAYSKSEFVDSTGNNIWSSIDYLSPLSSSKWKKSHSVSAYEEVQRNFSRLNIIPNASSALFRNRGHLSILDDDSWRKMKVCGDWAFYLAVARDGVISYTTKTSNYYRVHGSNISSSVYTTDRYYKELSQIGEYLIRFYNIKQKSLEYLWEKALFDFKKNCPGRDIQELDILFNKKRLFEKSSDPKLVIGLCIFGFASGGGETFPIKMANTFFRNGNSVILINFNLAPLNERIKSMLLPGVSIITLRHPVELEDYVRRFGINVLHSHNLTVDKMIMNQCGHIKDIARIVTLHGMYEDMSKSEVDTVLPKLMQSVSAWVYTANKNLTVFNQKGISGDQFLKMDNAVEKTDFQKLSRSSFNIPEDAFVVCLISRAIKEKGWREAIEIVASARNQTNLDLRLLLVGDGPMYSEILGTTPEFVSMLGFQENVKGLFSLSNIGMLPSYFAGESFPLVVLECLVVGRPVVATDVGEVRYMLLDNDSNLAGHVIELDHGQVPVELMARAIARIATNKDEYKSLCEVAKKVAERFDINKMCGDYEKIYKEKVYSLI
jgi:glycosyltransferase involved in cell wall biosynthesis